MNCTNCNLIICDNIPLQHISVQCIIVLACIASTIHARVSLFLVAHSIACSNLYVHATFYSFLKKLHYTDNEGSHCRIGHSV